MINHRPKPPLSALMEKAIFKITKDCPLEAIAALAESTLLHQSQISGFLWAMRSANGYIAVCHKKEVYYAPMLDQPAENGAWFDAGCWSSFVDMVFEDEQDAAKQIVEILKSPVDNYFLIELSDQELVDCEFP